MTDSISSVRSELAPTGILRVALNMSNSLLTTTDSETGEPSGLAADLGRELGRRLGVAVALLLYPNPGALADAASANAWDVGFLGADPQRAHVIDFTAAYIEIGATYLVPAGSQLAAIAEVDSPGVRIAAMDRSAYELYLTRNLRHAHLVRVQPGDNAFKRFIADNLDALAGLRPILEADQENLPGSRLLDGHFTTIQQAAGTPNSRPVGARYLCAFIEDIKATGLVAQRITKYNLRGLTVASPALTPPRY